MSTGIKLLLVVLIFQAASLLQIGAFLTSEAEHKIELQELPYLGDFNHYYLTAALSGSGSSPYCVPLGDHASPRIRLHEFLNTATNPPLLALTTMPLGLLSIENAWLAWQTILLLSMLLSLALVASELGWSRTELILAALIFFECSFTILNFRFGQVQPLLLLLCVAGWSAIRNGRSVAGGIIWGFAAALKFYLWPLLLLCLFRRERKLIFASGLSFAVSMYLPIIYFGQKIYSEFSACAKPLIEKSATAFPMNYSFGGMLQHAKLAFGLPMLKSFDPGFAVEFYLLPLTLSALAVFILERRFRNMRNGFDLAAAAAAFIGALSSPVAWPHYFVFTAFLAAVCYRRSNPLLLGILLICFLGIPFLPPAARMTTLEKFIFAFRPLLAWSLLVVAAHIDRFEKHDKQR